MSRNLDASLGAAVISRAIAPVLLLHLTFRSGPQYVWSGVGSLVYAGHTYLGVGSLGKIGVISEGTEVRSEGTSVTLSGIDPTLLNECLTDIQIGALAELFFAVLDSGMNVVGTPYTVFRGTVDKCTSTPGPETLAISLSLENRLANLQRPTMRRYTAADQHIQYPTDTAFNRVEQMNDLALKWGTA